MPFIRISQPDPSDLPDPPPPLSSEERIERLESAVGLLVLHIRGEKPLTDDELAMIEEDLRKGAKR